MRLFRLQGGGNSISGNCKTSGEEVNVSDLLKIKTGNGSPEGVVVASVGTLYLRLNGSTNSTLYVKESGTGSTGWVSK
jgi:hypothetical protein